MKTFTLLGSLIMLVFYTFTMDLACLVFAIFWMMWFLNYRIEELIKNGKAK